MSFNTKQEMQEEPHKVICFSRISYQSHTLLIARVPANFLRHPLKRAFEHFTMTSGVRRYGGMACSSMR